MRHRARGLAVVALAASFGLPLGMPPAQAADETCRGLPATIVGTAGSDVLIGTEGPDVIAGLEGDDQISGRGSDDLICGLDGSDLLVGGSGDDRLYAGLDGIEDRSSPGGAFYQVVEGDFVEGGHGDDLLDLGYDARQLTMPGETVDTLQLSGARGTVFRIPADGEKSEAVGDGRDRVIGQPVLQVIGSVGPDHIWGTPYGDQLSGREGDDVIRGLGGDDVIYSGHDERPFSDDRLVGGAGEDRIFAGRGHDEVSGGPGKDVLSAGKHTAVSGGPGNDRIDYSSAGLGCVTLVGDGGKDHLALWPSRATKSAVIPLDLDGGPVGSCGEVAGMETVFLAFGLSGAGPTWQVRGTRGPDRVTVSEYGGRVVGRFRAGDDSFVGGPRDDVARGGSGDDVADGGGGDDSCLEFESVLNCELE